MTQDRQALLRGRSVVSADGEQLGKIETVYPGAATQPEKWIAVTSGLLRKRTSIVPLVDAEEVIGDIHVAYPKDQVARAPCQEPPAELTSVTKRGWPTITNCRSEVSQHLDLVANESPDGRMGAAHEVRRASAKCGISRQRVRTR